MLHVTTQEKIDAIREAQEKLFEAIELISDICDEGERRTYLATLECLASDNHGWMSRDRSFDGWVCALEDRAREDEGEDMGGVTADGWTGHRAWEDDAE